MKIFFTQDALINAGSEKSHLEIISRFSDKTEASMVYFYPRHDLREEYIQAGIRLHFLDLKGSYDFINGVKKLVRLIREEKPDLLVSCLYRADIMTRIASKITGVPVFGTLVNDSYGEYSRKDKKGLKHSLVWLLDRWTAGIPIHWIANAKSLVDSHVKTLGLKREKISVVYRGRQVPPRSVSPRSVSPRSVSPRSVSPQTETNSSPRSVSSQTGINNNKIMPCEVLPTGQADTSHGETNDDKRMSCEDLPTGKAGTGHGFEDLPTGKADTGHGFVVSSIRNFISYGRLLERKGFQEAILAFSEVVKQYPDCTLTIYGEGGYRKELERLVTSLGLERQVALPGKFGGETSSDSYRMRVEERSEAISSGGTVGERTENERPGNQEPRDKNLETRIKTNEIEGSNSPFMPARRGVGLGGEDGRRKTEEKEKLTDSNRDEIKPFSVADGTLNLQSPVSKSPNPQSPISNLQSPNPLIPNPQSLNFSSHNLLLKSDCFIFPSWYEGFSGALVEAMMAGIPIIASDIPMNLEAVTADKNALTFPVKDVEVLVRKMLYAIENPDRMAELGKSARLEAIQRFDIEKIAREYEGVLRVIIAAQS